MRYPPPGQLIDVGGHRLHLSATGEGPVVVFDAALGGSSISWTLVTPHVTPFARVCVYDRAGFGWSDAGPMPRTAGRIADELRLLLDRSGEKPPYVLVGHSFGGLVMRIFAKRYRDVSAGLVLVDPAQPEDWLNPGGRELERLRRGALLCRFGARAARVGVASVVSALVGRGALTPAWSIARWFTGGELRADDQWILGPLRKLPIEARGPIRTSSAETLEAAVGGYGDLPLVTITQANPGEHRMRQQTALAALSTRGRHVIAHKSGHWIPLDEPDVVREAIRTVLG
jgi:pimeloyl-ACP methyl ester carboxylesterase